MQNVGMASRLVTYYRKRDPDGDHWRPQVSGGPAQLSVCVMGPNAIYAVVGTDEMIDCVVTCDQVPAGATLVVLEHSPTSAGLDVPSLELGHVDNGQVVTSVHNELFVAPVAQHPLATTDFLLVRYVPLNGSCVCRNLADSRPMVVKQDRRLH